jgi:uncharacterized protein (DUF1810 family)
VTDRHDLQRFVDAQTGVFEGALSELRAGKKQGHWMWFIFPQLSGLGRSATAQFYGIGSLDEARAYLAHPLLGPRLRQCAEALLPWAARRSAEQILGPIDALKLRSCLTLYDRAEPGSVFQAALAAFFASDADARTLALLNGEV